MALVPIWRSRPYSGGFLSEKVVYSAAFSRRTKVV